MDLNKSIKTQQEGWDATRGIELDEILYTPNPDWEKVVLYFRFGEWYEESYQVEGIKLHLRDEEDRKIMFSKDMSIEDILNGRTGADQDDAVSYILNKWNKKLRYKVFGSRMDPMEEVK